MWVHKNHSQKNPIAFAYTYDPEVDTPQKRFIESFVVDKVVAHLDRIIYSVSDRSFTDMSVDATNY